MQETIAASSKKQQTGLYGYLCRRRVASAKVFPHQGEDGAAYVERINGCKLSKASIRALKRA